MTKEETLTIIAQNSPTSDLSWKKATVGTV
jgi:hypothetical protein